MKIIGLTGGIGSGKTTVSGMFAALGVPVYNSDLEAKRLMHSSRTLRHKISDLLGEKAYQGRVLQRQYVAEKVFKDAHLLKELNAIVHPAVKRHFRRWTAKQSFPYVIQEAAILFENGSYPAFDKMILVTAPEEIRIARIQQRDGATRKSILERMGHQWNDDQKAALADYIIENTDLDHTRDQVALIHAELLEL
ncbi:MAG: dephospho-CoA kinase [Eudoraea sp.]|nr:dephospho-CoA kinase [Eudoraea sp.]